MSSRRIFGTNGVRGIPGEDLNLQFISAFGCAIGTYFDVGHVLVGYDGRVSSQPIAKSMSAALMASGIDVFESGMLPTPALQWAVRNLGYRGGVMITASHNPPQYNGIKVVGGDGVEISREDEAKIESIYFSSSQRKADWATVGKLGSESGSIGGYVSAVAGKIASDLVRKRGFKVVLDLGNGVQALTAPQLLEELGCRCLTINSHIDGRFPGRGPEPVPDVLKGLSETVKVYGADLGVAFDGDGDRSIFADDKGRVHWGDLSGSVIAEHIVSKRPGSTIVTTVSTSQIIDYVALRRGAKVLRTRVGSVDVSREMIRVDAAFGVEENGGCFYGAHLPVRDGGMSLALMLERLASEKTALSEIFDELPVYCQKKSKFDCPREKAQLLLDYVSKRVDVKIDRTDGLKIYSEPDTWILIRPSGTEPVVRVFSESREESKLNQTWSKYTALIEEFLSKS